MEDNKRKALSAALSQIEKQFGKGAVMRMGDVSAVRDVDVVSTGSLGLDVALGIGGMYDQGVFADIKPAAEIQRVVVGQA